MGEEEERENQIEGLRKHLREVRAKPREKVKAAWKRLGGKVEEFKEVLQELREAKEVRVISLEEVVVVSWVGQRGKGEGRREDWKLS